MKFTLKTKIIALSAAVLIALGGTVTAVTLINRNKATDDTDNIPVSTVTLKVWHTLDGTAKEVFEKDLAKAFKEENPNIRLSIVRFDYKRADLVSMINGNKAPDVVILPSSEVMALEDENVLKDFTGLKDLKAITDSQFPVIAEQNSVGGKVYGLSINALVNVANYNKTALSEAGLTEPPKTYSALADLKPMLGESKFPIGVNDYECDSLLPLFLSMGGVATNQAGTEAIGYLDSEQSINALTQLSNYSKTGIMNNGTDKDRKTAIDGVKDGTYLMTAGSSIMFSRAKLSTGDFTAAVMPTNENGTSVSTASGESAVICMSSKNRNEAWTYLSYIASEAGQKIIAKSGDLPARKSVAEASSTEKTVPFAKVYLQQLKNASSMIGKTNNQDSAKGCLTNLFSKILVDGKEIEVSAKTAARQLDALLKGEPMPLDASDATIEAESGKLSGTAKINTDVAASNSQYVNGLNYADGNPNRVTFENVLVNKPGTYEVIMGYSSGTDGTVCFRVNGEEFPVAYKITDAQWAFKRNTAVGEIPLKGDGTDIIEIYDMVNFSYCWVDYFQLNFKSSKMITSPLKGVGDGRIEAESGILTGQAEVVIDVGASGTKFVKGLNYVSGNKNTLTLNKLNVTKPGTYSMTVCYSSGTNGVVAAKVNADEYLVPYKLTDTAWGFKPNTVKINICLKGDGKDSIIFYDYDVSGFCWIDYIKLDFLSGDMTDPSKSGIQDGRIEAESGTLIGTAQAVVHPDASGAKYVSGLNNEDGNASNRVRFTGLNVTAAGTYRLEMTYSSGTKGIIGISVNGTTYRAGYSITSESWNFVPNTVSVDIALKGDGTDVLEFYDFDNYMYVWIDYFKLVFKDTEIIPPTPVSNRMEAENAELIGGAVIASAAEASEGRFVKNLNNEDGSAPNRLSFSPAVDTAAIYTMKVCYSSGMSGSVVAEVNGIKSYVPYWMTSEAWDFVPGETTVDVLLKGDGSDKIVFYDTVGQFCWIDYIELTYKGLAEDVDTQGHYEAENAELVGGATITPDIAASNGAYVNTLNTPDGSNAVRFTGLPEEGLGIYEIKITYSSGSSGNVAVKANSKTILAPYTMTDSRWAFVPGTVTVKAALSGNGNDTIEIHDENGKNAWIWIDYIEVTKVSSGIILEAEDGELLNGAVKVENTAASGGAYVNNLNNAGSLRFRNIPLTQAGAYRITVAYSSGTNGEMNIRSTSPSGTVNQQISYTVTDAGWGFVPNTVTANVNFKGDGTDALVFTDYLDGTNVGYIWIDYIIVEYVGD